MLSDMLINRRRLEQIKFTRFIGYAIDVNWSNTSQISKANESNFVNYKTLTSSLRMANAISELYQNQSTILKVEPADRDPSDPKQDSNYTNEEYLHEFDHQLRQPLRDPHCIFSKSALQQKRSDLDTSKVTNSSSQENTSTAQQNGENPPLLRSKRNLRQTEKCDTTTMMVCTEN